MNIYSNNKKYMVKLFIAVLFYNYDKDNAVPSDTQREIFLILDGIHTLNNYS